MIIRRNALEETGLLDDDFFLYKDDLDLGLRARLIGYRILCAPSSIVFHKYSFKKNERRLYFEERNRIVLLLKIYEKKTLLLTFPCFILLELGLLIRSLKEGWFRAKINGYRDVLRNLRSILEKRKKIQRTRRIPDLELFRFMTGPITCKGFDRVIYKIANPILSRYFKIVRSILTHMSRKSIRTRDFQN